MTNDWWTYEYLTILCSYVTTGTVFQIALRCRRYFPQWEEWEIFLGENVFSSVTNSSLKLKMNICILELLILFSKKLLFLYYIQVTRFGFFLRKTGLSSYLLLFYFILGMIHDSFFPENRESYFRRPILSFDLFFRLKTKLFSRFYQKQKMQKWLKYFARINLCVKGKLKLSKI